MDNNEKSNDELGKILDVVISTLKKHDPNIDKTVEKEIYKTTQTNDNKD